MRDAAMKSSKKILRAYTTEAVMGGERYCVAGKAFVNENEIKEFKHNLRSIHSKEKRSTGIEKLKVLVSR